MAGEDDLDRGTDEDFSDIDAYGDSGYIGVPKGFTNERETGRRTVTSNKGHYGYSTITTEPEVETYKPRYKSGDEFKAPRGFSPERVAPYQYELMQAGLLSGDFAYGTWDDKTAAAWKKVLAYANRSGISSRAALDEFKMRPIPQKAGGRTRLPLTVELENPDDIRASVAAYVPGVLGRNITKAESEQFVALYHQLQAAAQTAAYNGAATVTRPPDLRTFAEGRAKELHPEEAATFKKFELGNEVMQILGLTGQVRER